MEPHVNYEMVNSSKYKKKLEEIAKESIKNGRPGTKYEEMATYRLMNHGLK